MSELEMISAKMLDAYRKRSDTLLIDLRSSQEYFRYHIPGARHIDYEDTEALFALPKNKEIILYCERGASSMARAKEMARLGYNVKSLIGGVHAYRAEAGH